MAAATVGTAAACEAEAHFREGMLCSELSWLESSRDETLARHTQEIASKQCEIEDTAEHLTAALVRAEKAECSLCDAKREISDLRAQLARVREDANAAEARASVAEAKAAHAVERQVAMRQLLGHQVNRQVASLSTIAAYLTPKDSGQLPGSI